MLYILSGLIWESIRMWFMPVTCCRRVSPSRKCIKRKTWLQCYAASESTKQSPIGYYGHKSLLYFDDVPVMRRPIGYWLFRLLRSSLPAARLLVAVHLVYAYRLFHPYTLFCHYFHNHALKRKKNFFAVLLTPILIFYSFIRTCVRCVCRCGFGFSGCSSYFASNI